MGLKVPKLGIYTSVGTTRGQGIIRVVVVLLYVVLYVAATFFVTFSFLKDF